jgi:hypothetical protein
VLAIVAPILFLIHPAIVLAESRGGVEMLFSLLLVLFCVTLVRAVGSKRLGDDFLSGGVLGLTVITRSTLIVFPFLLLLYLFVVEGRRGNRLKLCTNVAAMLLAMFTVLSPWIIRNFKLTGKFVPTASVLGVSAHAGQYICTHLTLDSRWVDLDFQAARERGQLAQELGYPFRGGYYQVFYSSNDEIRFSNELFKRVLGEYKKSPMLFAQCMGANAFNVWFAGKTWRSTALNLAIQLPYLILAICGLVWAANNGQLKTTAPLALVVVCIVAVHLPILAQARYSVPLIPVLSIFAGMALVEAHAVWGRMREAPLAPRGRAPA